MNLLGIVIVISVLALLFVVWLTRQVLRKDTGTPAMREVSDAIKEGAEAFVNRQYATIGVYTLILAVIIFAVYAFLGKTDLGWRTSVAFLFGAVSSAVAGIVSMLIAVRANIRTASAAKRSLNEAFVTALRGGAVAGIIIVSMSLLGVALIYYFFSLGLTVEQAAKQVPFLIVAMVLALLSWHYLHNLAAEFIPRLLMSARIWSAKWKREFPKTIQGILQSLLI